MTYYHVVKAEVPVSAAEGNNLRETVRTVLEQVKIAGDVAVRAYSRQFDQYHLGY